MPERQGLEALPGLLLPWYRAHARRLPWRDSPTPYAVLVSEIMLQQTRVEAALPYFERFMAELPDFEALAGADEAQLLKLWQGLGYYSRARNLQKAAQLVVQRHGGQLPADLRALRALPGVGDYTAGAVASIAFGLPGCGGGRKRAARVCKASVQRGEPLFARLQKGGGAPGGGPDAEGAGGRLHAGAHGAGGHRLPAKRQATVRSLPGERAVRRRLRGAAAGAAGQAGEKGASQGAKGGAAAVRRGADGAAAPTRQGAFGRPVGAGDAARHARRGAGAPRGGGDGRRGEAACPPAGGKACLHPCGVAYDGLARRARERAGARIPPWSLRRSGSAASSMPSPAPTGPI